jgi:hypothetical protein
MRPADQAEIELAAHQFAGLLTRHLPDFLRSLSLVGSAVDGDYRAGRSDLDFVAVMNRAAREDELEGLTIVHRLYAADLTLPKLDGIWVTPVELAAGPDEATSGPSTEDGVFLADARGNRNPVSWFTLYNQGRTILGELDRAGIWRDPVRLASWTRENVEAYWAHWHQQSARVLSRRGLAMLGGEAPMWGVLGISRLHFTLATGEIASKSAAGEHALKTFELRWHRIIKESIRIRRGEPGTLYSNPLARRRDALDFVATAIATIRRNYPASE